MQSNRATITNLLLFASSVSFNYVCPACSASLWEIEHPPFCNIPPFGTTVACCWQPWCKVSTENMKHRMYHLSDFEIVGDVEYTSEDRMISRSFRENLTLEFDRRLKKKSMKFPSDTLKPEKRRKRVHERLFMYFTKNHLNFQLYIYEISSRSYESISHSAILIVLALTWLFLRITRVRNYRNYNMVKIINYNIITSITRVILENHQFKLSQPR